MDYLQWNNRIAAHFFNEERARCNVYLYVTEELINRLGSHEQVNCQDFIRAIKKGPSCFLERYPNIFRTALALKDLDQWRFRKLNYPPYIGYLAFLVLAASHDDFASKNYRKRLNFLLGENEKRQHPDFHRMLELWDDLENWANQEKGEEWGSFQKITILKHPHVGLIYGQTLLTEQEIKVLPTIFDAANLLPNSSISEQNLAKLLIEKGNKILNKRTIRLLESGINNEFCQALLNIVLEELAKWDGTGEFLSENGTLIYRCLLGFSAKWDRTAQILKLQVRCKIGKNFPEKGLSFDDKYFCEPESKNWSTPISINLSQYWQTGFELKSSDQECQFKLYPSKVRLLISGSGEGLSGLIEYSKLLPNIPFYLIVHQSCSHHIEQWGKSDCKEFEKVEINQGLPPGWNFYKAEAALRDTLKDQYPILAFPTTIKLNLEGGIRLEKGNEFFAFAPPKFILESGNESTTVQGYFNETLLNLEYQNGIYTLPLNTPTHQKIEIKVYQGDKIINYRSLELLDHFDNQQLSEYHYFDSFGQLTQNSRGVAGGYFQEYQSPAFQYKPIVATNIAHNIVLIGRKPGEIANHLDQFTWQPIWEIHLGKKFHSVKFCGNNKTEYECFPQKSSCTDLEKLQEWKKLLWKDRKKFIDVSRGKRDLWEQYTKAAKKIKTTPSKSSEQLTRQEATIDFPENCVQPGYPDQMLYVISVKQTMRWQNFKEIVNCLSNQEEEEQRQYLNLRSFLDSLGHCDFDFTNNNNKVYACPPVLVRLPNLTLSQGVLAGLRFPDTLERLSQVCESINPNIYIEVEPQPQKYQLLPQRVFIETETENELEEIATRLNLHYNPIPTAWSLVNFSVSLIDYLQHLEWSNEGEINWKRKTFEPEKFLFTTEISVDSNIGLREYIHPKTQVRSYYLWRDQQSAKVDKAWGIYAVLQELQKNVLRYDPDKAIIAIPAGASLPKLLERALTLCSGYIPKYKKLPKSEIVFKVFRDVPDLIANKLAEKLCQTLHIQDLNL